jgi:hypothetical protein
MAYIHFVIRLALVLSTLAAGRPSQGHTQALGHRILTRASLSLHGNVILEVDYRSETCKIYEFPNQGVVPISAVESMMVWQTVGGMDRWWREPAIRRGRRWPVLRLQFEPSDEPDLSHRYARPALPIELSLNLRRGAKGYDKYLLWASILSHCVEASDGSGRSYESAQKMRRFLEGAPRRERVVALQIADVWYGLGIGGNVRKQYGLDLSDLMQACVWRKRCESLSYSFFKAVPIPYDGSIPAPKESGPALLEQIPPP